VTPNPHPTRTVRGWRRALILTVGLAAVGLAAVACTDDPADVTLDVDGTQVGIDRRAILGELTGVRALFAERSALPAEVIGDVDYEEGTLDVTLAPASAERGAETAGQAEQVCNDLREAIQLPNLTINVHGPDGARLASCEFGR
jgi:hypothetical protein